MIGNGSDSAVSLKFETKRAFSIVEFAGIFGISRSLVYKLITSGQLKTAKILGRTVIVATEVERFAASLEAAE